MALIHNSHIERLQRFQPFTAGAADLVFEQSAVLDSSYETDALAYVRRRIESPGYKVCVLSGDAGHGKTHLCAQVLESLGLGAKEAVDHVISGHPAQSDSPPRTKGGRRLRIVKDLSEHTVGQGAEILAAALHQSDDSVSLICANEGRLRRAIRVGADLGLSPLLELLNQTVAQGRCESPDGNFSIVNLNYQSVVRDNGKGVAAWALNTWGVDRRRWRACSNCDAKSSCPIYSNHTALAEGSAAPLRRERVLDLFRVAEQSGYVLTVRHTLATIAHCLNGGLTCHDVHKRVQRAPRARDWQYRFLFHENLFGDRLSIRQRRQVPTFRAFRFLDPGKVATRSVDDGLALGLGLAADVQFHPIEPSSEENSPRNRKELDRYADLIHGVMRTLRRRAYFEDADGLEASQRMGLSGGASFGRLTRGEVNGQPLVEERDRIFRGLESAQGLRRQTPGSDLYVLDPAFVNAHSRAAIVGRRVRGRDARLLGQLEHWASGNSVPDLALAVDWLSRLTFLHLGDDLSVPLNLIRFELLIRWSEGLSIAADDPDARFINAQLGTLASRREDSDEIVILVNGKRKTLEIDSGDRIRSGDS